MTQATVRYFVTDVDEAIDFHCNRLGFVSTFPLAPGLSGTKWPPASPRPKSFDEFAVLGRSSVASHPLKADERTEAQ